MKFSESFAQITHVSAIFFLYNNKKGGNHMSTFIDESKRKDLWKQIKESNRSESTTLTKKTAVNEPLEWQDPWSPPPK